MEITIEQLQKFVSEAKDWEKWEIEHGIEIVKLPTRKTTEYPKLSLQILPFDNDQKPKFNERLSFMSMEKYQRIISILNLTLISDTIQKIDTINQQSNQQEQILRDKKKEKDDIKKKEKEKTEMEHEIS